MFIFFNKKEKATDSPQYVIAFCDENDLSTKFGAYPHVFDSYDSAKQMIFSKANGWGNAIIERVGDSACINCGWLIIEKIN